MTAVSVCVAYTGRVATYRRDELAELSGVPARTIRYYQSVGLLPKPERVGKEAVFNGEHLNRLRQIADMHAKGLRLEGIREVFNNTAVVRANGADWRSLFEPHERGPERGEVLTDARLFELLGDRRPEILDDLIAAGYLYRTDRGWHVPDYPALKGAVMLYDLGTDVRISQSVSKLVRSRLAALADDVVDTLTDAAGDGYAGDGTLADLLQFVDRFRAAAHEVAGETFADEIERAVTERGR